MGVEALGQSFSGFIALNGQASLAIFQEGTKPKAQIIIQDQLFSSLNYYSLTFLMPMPHPAAPSIGQE
jgi:hypothetical protein